jgi:AhpD family alkylhydroperoxidase
MRSLWRAGTNPGALLGRRIGAALREQLIVHVSSVNDCAVCAGAHTVIGRAAGVSSERLAAARRQELPDDERARAAVRYAELRTRGLEAESPEVVREFEERFDPEEQREIRAIVDAFTFVNRFNNSWESWLPGAEARRRRLGLGPPDEGEDSSVDRSGE